MWTTFWDMHSGGGLKEGSYHVIYIEAPQKEAEIIFYNRFGHNPNRITCTCCGEDYSISEDETLEQATAWHRNCKWAGPVTVDMAKRNREGRYVEANEPLPEGWSFEKSYHSDKYITLDEYVEHKDVLVIHANQILPEERVGEVPEAGWVWVGS